MSITVSPFSQFPWDPSMLPTIRTALIFGAVLILLRLYMTSKLYLLRAYKMPPGPITLPIIGFLPFLGKDFHLTLTELGRKFGSVYQIFLGTKRIIVVSDPNLVREAFKQPVFSGRPDTELTKLLQGYGIINSDGALWKEQRTFLHNVLREFGAKNFNKPSALENNIQREVQEFLNDLEKKNGAACKVRPSLARAVSNVVGTLLMSVTFSANDCSFERLLSLFEEGFRLISMSVPVNFIPMLRFFPFFNYAYRKIKNNKQETSSFFHDVAEKHRESLDGEADRARDFVDAFLMQQKKIQKCNKQSFFTEKQLIQVMGDIFSAGLETVTSTIEWCVLFMLRNPEVQRKVQVEIDAVIGDSRQPCAADMPFLPYTEATVLETLRRANIIALGNAHATLEDTELGGYFIPKNSHVLPNLWAIHMNPELWDAPEEFNPDRFLVDGKVTKPKHFMPFSVGRRMCVGDVLARMEVFLFLSTMLQRFELKVPEGETLPTPQGIAAASMTARPFNVCAVPRRKTV